MEARFNTLRNAIAYDLLAKCEGDAAARDRVASDFAAIRADTDEYLIPVVDHVEAELQSRIEREGSKSPLHRRIIKWTPIALGTLALAIYLAAAVYERIPIDRPLETRAGIEQRAAALRKTMRHAEWTDTRRNRLVVELLFWPISPNDAEQKGASEFVELVLGARAALRDAHTICGAPAADVPVTDADIEFAGRIADDVRGGGLTWKTPAPLTLLAPVRADYPCG